MTEWTKDGSTIIEFDEENPHKEGTAVYQKYEAVKVAGTVGEAKEYGAYAYDLGEWFKKGKLRVLEKVESKGGPSGGGKGGFGGKRKDGGGGAGGGTGTGGGVGWKGGAG
eukprot:5987192-Karenia_brevis.AAC.1